MTLASARERPTRFTLPYQPMRWSMMAHCILHVGRWRILKPIACNAPEFTLDKLMLVYDIV